MPKSRQRLWPKLSRTAAEAPAEKPAKKPAAKKAPAKKTATKAKTPAKAAEKKTTAKTTKAIAPVETVKVQFGGDEYDFAEIKKAVEADYKSKFKGKVKNIEFYIKPEDKAVYYVINGDFSDKIELWFKNTLNGSNSQRVAPIFSF